MRFRKAFILLLLAMLFSLASCQEKRLYADSTMPSNFKVAFIGDQGLNENSTAVLQLIKDENTSMVLHLGDFDYNNDPERWNQQINGILGSDFPYFASVGNHDVSSWRGYKQRLQERLEKIEGAVCTGDLGVRSACSYKGLFFILSGIGTKYKGVQNRLYNKYTKNLLNSFHVRYIKRQLAVNDNFTWKICAWHKNQRLMQAGNKRDEIGWEAYEECRKAGAIIGTGHEHSYSRTHLMDNFETQSIASTSNEIHIEKGKTFAFVSGLGGKSIRSQNEDIAGKDRWGAVYTLNQKANHGALFCIFNKDGIENKAYCYFKDIDGNIPDEFSVISEMS